MSYGRNVALTLALAGAQIGARPNEWDGVAYYTQVVASVAGDMTRRATVCWDGVMKDEVVVVVSDVDDIGQHKASRARARACGVGCGGVGVFRMFPWVLMERCKMGRQGARKQESRVERAQECDRWRDG